MAGRVRYVHNVAHARICRGDDGSGPRSTVYRRRSGYTAFMRLGVLDIGSNCAQLQVVDAYPGAPPLPTHAVKEPTLLGEAFQPDGTIDDAGVDRVVAAVGRAVRAASGMAVDELYVFGTSAIRDANNRAEIIELIERDCGVCPDFLSGEQEARLTYLAVHRWYGWSARRLLMLDIGGGSMEIVLGRDAVPEFAVSLPLGAGRLTRRFLAQEDPPSDAQLTVLHRHVKDNLREVADRLRWEGDPHRVVVTSKTFKQLARLAGAPPQRKGPFVRRSLHRRDVTEWLPRLAAIPAAERARLRGVSESRSRQIVAGAVVARTAMRMLDIRRAEVCPWALREGIILRHLHNLGAAEPEPLPRLASWAGARAPRELTGGSPNADHQLSG